MSDENNGLNGHAYVPDPLDASAPRFECSDPRPWMNRAAVAPGLNGAFSMPNIPAPPSMHQIDVTCPTAVDAPLPPLRSVMDLFRVPPVPEDNLLGDYFFFRRGGMMFIGPTGVGKSSACMQMALCWAIGRTAFDLRPARAMRILLVQAENVDHDLTRVINGVIEGMGFTVEEQETLRKNVMVETVKGLRGKAFITHCRRRLQEARDAGCPFDILWIDPLYSYFDGNVSDPEHWNKLTDALQPIMDDFNIGCIINHHTPKINNRDTSGWTSVHQAYAGAGSANQSNWVRCGLVIEPTHVYRVFTFHSIKRIKETGWVDDNGEVTPKRMFAHARDGMYWINATEADLEDVEAAKPQRGNGGVSSKPVISTEELVDLVPVCGPIPKEDLLEFAYQDGKYAQKATQKKLRDLITAGILVEQPNPRPGGGFESPNISRPVRTGISGDMDVLEQERTGRNSGSGGQAPGCATGRDE